MALSLPALAREQEDFPAANSLEFDKIVVEHQRKIYRILLLMLKNPDDADHLTQECFLRAFATMKSFRGECSLQTWLTRIALNLAHDHIRNRRASFWKRFLRFENGEGESNADEFPSQQTSPERELIAKEQLKGVWRALDLLPARQKEIFLLRFVEEMELKEIAEVLRLKVGTVKTQLFRAVHRVRKEVGHDVKA